MCTYASNCNWYAPLFHRPGFYLILFFFNFPLSRLRQTVKSLFSIHFCRSLHYAYFVNANVSYRIIWVDSTYLQLNSSHIHFQYNNNKSNIFFFRCNKSIKTYNPSLLKLNYHNSWNNHVLNSRFTPLHKNFTHKKLKLRIELLLFLVNIKH